MKERVYKKENLNPWQKLELCAPFDEGKPLPKIQFTGLLNSEKTPRYRQFRRGQLMCFEVENTSDYPATVELVVFDK